MLAAGLNDQEVADGLYGSLGFAEDVKSFTKRYFGLDPNMDLRAFASQWILDNPIPVQGIIEAAKPHPSLMNFYVRQYHLPGYGSHALHLDAQYANDPQQVVFLDQYVNEIVNQNLDFNFTGGSTLDGVPLPGWTALKHAWPRRLLLGVRRPADPNSSWLELSYSNQNDLMCCAMFAWLSTQFAAYSSGILNGRPGDTVDVSAGDGRRPQC